MKQLIIEQTAMMKAQQTMDHVKKDQSEEIKYKEEFQDEVENFLHDPRRMTADKG